MPISGPEKFRSWLNALFQNYDYTYMGFRRFFTILALENLYQSFNRHMYRHRKDYLRANNMLFEYWTYQKVTAYVSKIGSLVQAEIAKIDVPSKKRVVQVAEILDEAKGVEINSHKNRSYLNFQKRHF